MKTFKYDDYYFELEYYWQRYEVLRFDWEYKRAKRGCDISIWS